MAGCFGSDPYDRWLESRVNDYCDDPPCDECKDIDGICEECGKCAPCGYCKCDDIEEEVA